MLFTPSSRYSFSGVRLLVNPVLSDGCFRKLCSFEMPHDCCTKGQTVAEGVSYECDSNRKDARVETGFLKNTKTKKGLQLL